ncbi:hypothetical protein BD311DRAFT_743486 [Dichomitus squalens]|uniref:Uncharacterized protein n=1 Tax=Dichomitus squalens TaxID=114155 RepID=A0A4Q9M429_9APHY|nr:hypothetical protein BD311DRAFT_743486 [Dichomitus squalens]
MSFSSSLIAQAPASVWLPTTTATPENRQHTGAIASESFNIKGLYIAVQAVLVPNVPRSSNRVTNCRLSPGSGITQQTSSGLRLSIAVPSRRSTCHANTSAVLPFLLPIVFPPSRPFRPSYSSNRVTDRTNRVTDRTNRVTDRMLRRVSERAVTAHCPSPRPSSTRTIPYDQALLAVPVVLLQYTQSDPSPVSTPHQTISHPSIPRSLSCPGTTHLRRQGFPILPVPHARTRSKLEEVDADACSSENAPASASAPPPYRTFTHHPPASSGLRSPPHTRSTQTKSSPVLARLEHLNTPVGRRILGRSSLCSCLSPASSGRPFFLIAVDILSTLQVARPVWCPQALLSNVCYPVTVQPPSAIAPLGLNVDPAHLADRSSKTWSRILNDPDPWIRIIEDPAH